LSYDRGGKRAAQLKAVSLRLEDNISNVKILKLQWLPILILGASTLCTACGRSDLNVHSSPNAYQNTSQARVFQSTPALSPTFEPTVTLTPITPTSIPDPGGLIAYASLSTHNIHLISADGSSSKVISKIDVDQSCYNPNWSADGAFLAFQCWIAGNSNLYIADPDEDSIQQLIEGPTSELQPIWSPNGSRIAFITLLDPLSWAIDIITLDTKEVRRVATGEWDEIGAIEISYSWSPDGNRIIYSEFNDAQLYLVDADGGNHENVPCEDLADFAWNPVWSPNGQAIIYKETRGIRLLELTTCYDRMLIAEYLLVTPDWSPNGEIVSALGDGIHLNDLITSTTWVILDGETILQYTWAPDSQHIAFVGDLDQDTTWSIYTVNIHSEETHKLIDFDPELFGDIDWQP
jgi:TolB protein